MGQSREKATSVTGESSRHGTGGDSVTIYMIVPQQYVSVTVISSFLSYVINNKIILLLGLMYPKDRMLRENLLCSKHLKL